jgi:hypothetical protein
MRKANKEFIIKEFHQYNVNSHVDDTDDVVFLENGTTFPYIISVYENEIGTPCFYFTKKNIFEFKLKIPCTIEWNKSKDITIIDGVSCENNIHKPCKTWNNYENDKKKLIEWLDKTNKAIKEYSNIKAIRFVYNGENNGNEKTHDIL